MFFLFLFKRIQLFTSRSSKHSTEDLGARQKCWKRQRTESAVTNNFAWQVIFYGSNSTPRNHIMLYKCIYLYMQLSFANAAEIEISFNNSTRTGLHQDRTGARAPHMQMLLKAHRQLSVVGSPTRPTRN